MIDLYDRELLAAEKVAKKLLERTVLPRDVDAFSREIKERFEEIGFVVEVQWWSTNQDATYIPDIFIVERCAPLPHGFDFEEHGWEVRKDILGIDGFVQDKPTVFDPDNLHQLDKHDGSHQHHGDEDAHSVSEATRSDGSSVPHHHSHGSRSHTHEED